MTIAVTAASGRLGHALLTKLGRQAGSKSIIAIARAPEKIAVADVSCRQGDYTDLASLVGAFSGVDTAIMISAPVTIGTDRVAMHRNVIQAAKQAGVRKLVYTSVIGNGGEAETLFGATQAVNRQAEQDLQESGVEWIVARNGLYLELDLGHIILANKHGGVYRNNAGEGRCGYISIDEIAQATARLALDDHCNGQTLNIISEVCTQAELVAWANQVFDLNVRYEAISTEENIARFMQDERIAARGEEVARMLSGCFECIAAGAFDVQPDFERAAGRAAKPILQQMEEHRRRLNDEVS